MRTLLNLVAADTAFTDEENYAKANEIEKIVSDTILSAYPDERQLAFVSGHKELSR